MALKATPLALGQLRGTIYDFLDAGDVLPMHQHDETSIHITIVARGRFHCRGHRWERICGAGDVLDWQPHNPHEFVAIDAGSRLVNVAKG
jgi:quercetin dioxygenase-like cupin family protein